MTQASEVTVTREEAIALIDAVRGPNSDPSEYLVMRAEKALAAFLAARVPDARDYAGGSATLAAMDAGFNACRENVLRGPG